ncbi:2OG-Fe(II) oxygenase [Chitinophaga vietnamensis]|uniref:2OG-Fe(II) oxygenase n=1 Tax=Chitinophaga vietnamensis TaxID=2593957 RepID=UPI001177D440|nr:2OG-Fe(II) oxygenase [Chitinophaga vietnamensis]
MHNIITRIQALNWDSARDHLHQHGYALLPGVLDAAACQTLIHQYPQPELYRKTITMERYRFGLGEYKYFTYPLPLVIQQIRETVYPHLAPVANAWMKALNIPGTYPAEFQALQALCHSKGQTKPTVLILQYGEGGHNTLHQDLYGDLFFPIQLVLFLNEPGKDYTGGEFVLTEQRPRAQSRAIVLQPRQGDMLLFTTNFRPVKGSHGYYRVAMKHGVSSVHTGQRYTLGIIFHDAA